MIFDLFSVPIYHGKVLEKSKIENLFQNFNIENNLNAPIDWECNVKTTYSHDDIVYGWENPFTDCIKYNISEYFETLKVAKTRDGFYFKRPWLNIYEKEMFQERHNHITEMGFVNVLSYAYCLKNEDSESGSKFKFHNPNRFVSSLFSEVITQNVEVRLNEGEIIIFPSFLEHSVTKHESDFMRITIAGNIGILED